MASGETLGLFGDVDAPVAVCRERLGNGSLTHAEVVNVAVDLAGATIELLRIVAESAGAAGSADTAALDYGIDLGEDARSRIVSAWHLMHGAKALAAATVSA